MEPYQDGDGASNMAIVGSFPNKEFGYGGDSVAPEVPKVRKERPRILLMGLRR